MESFGGRKRGSPPKRGPTPRNISVRSALYRKRKAAERFVGLCLRFSTPEAVELRKSLIPGARIVVAFNRSRRQLRSSVPANSQSPDEGRVAAGLKVTDSVFGASASQPRAGDVEIRKAPGGDILKVRIGQWRVLTAGAHRRLAEVRELSCRRVAVLIEKLADNGNRPACEIWQLYDLDGRLEASLQSTSDGRFAMLTNYRTRQACRLAADSAGDLRAVETWKI
jgi:hypothetical protein